VARRVMASNCDRLPDHDASHEPAYFEVIPQTCALNPEADVNMEGTNAPAKIPCDFELAECRPSPTAQDNLPNVAHEDGPSIAVTEVENSSSALSLGQDNMSFASVPCASLALPVSRNLDDEFEGGCNTEICVVAR